jgi:serine/threonine protein kinase
VEKLGQGGFGTVYLARHYLSKEEIAIKRIIINHGIPADKINEVFKEAKNL